MTASAPPLRGTAGPAPHVGLWLLALFTFSGTLAMHIFVPALAQAGGDLNAGKSTMQMTVSLYIAGLAAGQLIYGPLSDRYGRRPVLMAGLVLYTAAGLAAALAPDAHSLIAARLFQALGGCAGLVLGRAIARDTAGPTDAAKRLALMGLIATLAPGAAPIVGGFIAATLGWRAILGMLCLLGIANLVLAWKLLPETGPAIAQASVRTLARHYRQLLASRAFVGFAVGGGFATTSMFAFIASAPYILVQELGRPDREVGISLAMLVFGVWIGNVITTRLVGKIPIARLMLAGNLLSVAAALALLVMVLTGTTSVQGLVATMFFYTMGAGMSGPTALTMAVSVNPHVVGSASGLYGAAQMGVGAGCTALAGLGASPSLSTALVLAGAVAASQLLFWMALRTPAPNR